ncbi:MAG: hypothetical protein NXH73_09005 [Flavobacteriaceae bacterium]|nr:hypothetical protein [Flavobacteriaceae bacterium]
MEFFNDYSIDWFFLAEVFLLMFVAFLIGYLFGKQKERPNFTPPKADKRNDIKEIETIFTELKPEIIKIIKEHKNTSKTKTAINEDNEVIKGLNFDNFGYGDEKNKDDLTKIEGLNPFIEEKLNQIGIFTYSQISRFTSDDIKALTHLLDYFPGRIERDEWVDQAKELKLKKATV